LELPGRSIAGDLAIAEIIFGVDIYFLSWWFRFCASAATECAGQSEQNKD